MSPKDSQSISSSPLVSQSRASARAAAILSERIRMGVYGSGQPLPTERVLAADLQVNRRSVRNAIDQLVQEGLVFQRPNCRPTVGPSPDDIAEMADGAGGSRISASNLIALIMWHGGGPLERAGSSQQRIFWGINQALKKFGYHAVFLDLGDLIGMEAETAAQEAAHLRYIRDQKFGGALFYPYAYRHNSALVREVSRSVPLVLLDRKMPGVDLDFVGVENHGALLEATDHLIAQGHRRIAHVTRSEPIQSVQNRVEGYLDAMRGASDPDSVRVTGATDITEMVLTVPSYEDDRDWTVVDAVFRLPQGQRPTAAVCFTDYMADSLAKRLEYLGLSVPKDVALTGFDNIVPALPNGVGLTSMAQPYEQIGATAVDLLMRRIKDPGAEPKSVELPASLIVRESSTG
ncbi:MAG: GntR family transcriptional regulator [Capsulimonas sp.]|uniref:GntR family transcriptional regulator n=1 Tax=Capsulimonas sp. TaxID=2494211 RepID=UPI00326584D9